MIVLEGVLFQRGSTQEIRKLLLEDFSVEAIISLPPGSFLPYTGVKASILVINKGKPTKQIWFFEVKNDGFDFSPSRRPIPGRNDIDILYEYWESKPETEQSWWTDIKRIAETNYVLSANRYLPIQAKVWRYPTVSLSKLLHYHKERIKIEDERLYKRVTVKSHGEGIELRDEVYGHQIRTKYQQELRVGQLVVSAIGAKDGSFGVVPPTLDRAIVSSHYNIYDVISSDVMAEYIVLVLNFDPLQKEIQSYVRGVTSQSSIRYSDFLRLKIPLPPLGKQQEYIDNVQKAKSAVEKALQQLDKTRQIIEQDIFVT